MCITFVTVGELMKWRVLRSWGPSRTDELARWPQDVGILAYDEAVADKCTSADPTRGSRAVEFGPDGLAVRSLAGPPALGELGDQEQAASALVEGEGPAEVRGGA